MRKREKWLRIFESQAQREKRRWFSRALSAAKYQVPGRARSRQAEHLWEGLRRILCLLFLFLSLWTLILAGQSGGWREEFTSVSPYRGLSEYEGIEEGKEGWEREIFGIRVRIHQGQITFLKEKVIH